MFSSIPFFALTFSFWFGNKRLLRLALRRQMRGRNGTRSTSRGVASKSCCRLGAVYVFRKDVANLPGFPAKNVTNLLTFTSWMFAGVLSYLQVLDVRETYPAAGCSNNWECLTCLSLIADAVGNAPKLLCRHGHRSCRFLLHPVRANARAVLAVFNCRTKYTKK